MTRHYIPRAYVPGTTTLLLTEARKMPCASWSLPAREACPFALNGQGAICGDCYADELDTLWQTVIDLAHAAEVTL